MKKCSLLLLLFATTAIALFLYQNKTPQSFAFDHGEEEIEGEYPSDWMFLQRAYPNNNINAEAFQEALKQTKHAKAEVTQRTASTWEQQGPFNIGGRITDVAIHPTDLNTYYIGTSVGGVFKTTDAGENWTPMFDNIGSPSIGNIAISQSDPETIYVGTGEANASATSGAFFGDGMYKSINGGQDWEHIGLQNAQHISRIVVDPQNPNRVFAGATGVLYGKDNNRGVYRTMNGGDTWEQIFFLSDSTACIDLALNPIDPNIIYACMWERTRAPWQRDYGGTTSGIFRSVDGGENWEELTTGNNGLPQSDEETGRIGIALCASQPDVLYASFTTNSITNVFNGLYKSTDGGDTWQQTNDENMEFVYASFGWFFGNVRVHPTNPDIAFVMGVALMRTVDGGQNWENITYMHVDQHGLEIHPDAPDFILLGNDGGVYTSEDGGDNWSHFKNLPITQFYRVEIDNLQPEILYGGTQDNNTLKTPTGDTDDWFSILGGDGFHVVVDPTNSDIVYAESQWGNLSRSFNGGLSMQSAMDGIDDDDRTNWNTPVVLSPFDNNVLYYGSNRLYVSQQAEYWTAISGDLTDGQHPSGSQSFGTLTTIAPSYNNLDVIYTGSDDGNVNVTLDGGTTWTNISEDLPNRYISRIAIHPEDDLTAIVCYSGYRSVDYIPHILMTENGGQTWEDISGNLPESPLNCVLIDPDQDNTLYVSSDMAVWYTTDLGENWELLGNNLPITIFNDLKFHQDTRTLVAGTAGRSIYSYPLESIDTKVAEISKDKNQFKVFPNPVQDMLNLSFDLPAGQEGSIQLFDMQGKVLRTFHSGKFQKGANVFEFEAGQLVAGNYIVRVRMADLILSRKVVKI